MVLPLLAVVICLFAFKLNEQNASTKNISITKSATNFKLVVDAGHGGKDYGVHMNGLSEKDVALKIAEKIKVLSTQYGIDVVLTRSNDVFMAPKEKSDFANSQNANAFISIHINAATKDKQKDESGIEVYLGNNEAILNHSKMLGSALIQNLQTDFNVAPSLMQRNVGIWVLKNSTIPAALIECGYITNANDLKLLQQDDKIELMAKNILQGVAMYANNKVDTSNLYKIKNNDTNVLTEPKFPGGNDAWKKYLEENLKAQTPADKGAPPGMYAVTISFLVDDNGKVSEVKAIKDPGFGTAAEAVRIIANGPNWIPATQNGHKVTYRQKQNITF
ncbi:unnamed protein product [Adineta steineri]|uniref:MurNAc-LAA domain-containing protein n=1 Tax=Adineta steineri TaxID=433720 RepID=A0A815PZ74_9BILA|nr:unnamed protein product [Adineta steineri]CAF4069004.1 unnamed protein product [Adineta steineri]